MVLTPADGPLLPEVIRQAAASYCAAIDLLENAQQRLQGHLPPRFA